MKASKIPILSVVILARFFSAKALLEFCIHDVEVLICLSTVEGIRRKALWLAPLLVSCMNASRIPVLSGGTRARRLFSAKEAFLARVVPGVLRFRFAILHDNTNKMMGSRISILSGGT